MKLPIRFRPPAEAEMEESQRWYDLQRPGWGAVFRERVDQTLQKIREGPESYPVVYRDVRQALVWRFPFAIYYIVEADEIAVISVFHASRDPRRWQSRA